MNLKKKRGTKVAAVAAALTLTMALAACGGTTDGAGTDTTAAKSPEEVIKQSQEKMQELKSMSYDMVMNMDMSISAGGQSQDMTVSTTGVADYMVDPMAMKMDMNMDMGEMGSMDIQMYVTEKDGTYTMYTGMGGQWSSQQVDMSSLEQYDAQANMDLYLTNSSSFKENGTETINNSEATRYDGVINNDALNEVMKASGVMSQMSSLGIGDTDMTDMLTDMGDLPISIWVDNESGLPVKYDMDMSQMMQTMMDKAMASTADAGGASVSVSKVQVSMTISNFDGVTSIEVPAEALAATAVG